MRLPISLLALYLSVSSCVNASLKAGSRLNEYRDPDITVTSPSMAAEVAGEKTTLSMQHKVDVISAATRVLTVDAVSSATRVRERRDQSSIAVTQKFFDVEKLSLTYTYSQEKDYVVKAPGLSFSTEIWQSMATLTFRYQEIHEAAGRSDWPSYREEATGKNMDFEYSQILNKELVFSLLQSVSIYKCGQYAGCFSNHYRYVGVRLQNSFIAMQERHPDNRVTSASAARFAFAFGDGAALHAGYRFFKDSWHIIGHTMDGSIANELLENQLLARLEVRGTRQSEANFFKSLYESDQDTAPSFRTADAELSSLWNFSVYLNAEMGQEPVRVVASLGRIWNRYPDFIYFQTRPAWILGLGVDVEL